MKKILASMALMLAACGQDNTPTETVEAPVAETPKHSVMSLAVSTLLMVLLGKYDK